MAFRVQDILQLVPGRLANEEALGNRLSGISVEKLSGLARSQATDLCFFFSKEYQNEVPLAAPGILITAEPFLVPLEKSGLPLWKSTAVIASPDPYSAMAVLSEKFAKTASTVAHLPGSRFGQENEIHATAVVSPLAKIGIGVRIGPHAVIEDGAEIGNGVVLYPGCYVGPSAKVGEDSVLFPGVTLYEQVELGARTRIHAGTVIGSDGFGYAPEIRDGKPVGHRKIYHLGKVVIGDDVEIGANCTIDRATLGETRIGAGTKLDNDVHIAHNSQLGKGVIFCGNSSTAGGAKVGNFVYVGGMSGITNRAHVGDYAKVAGMTGVSKDVAPGSVVSGVPHRDYQDHFKLNALFNRMLKEQKKSKGQKTQE